MAGAEALAGEKVYVPYSGILTGTEGTAPLRLSVVNDTGRDMACTVSRAHWYSDRLGRAAPGDAVTATLWHDPETGVIALLNQTEDRMPVEAVWCGAAGDMTATRTRIALPIAAGPAAARLDRLCREAPDGRFNCEEPRG